MGFHCIISAKGNREGKTDFQVGSEISNVILMLFYREVMIVSYSVFYTAAWGHGRLGYRNKCCSNGSAKPQFLSLCSL